MLYFFFFNLDKGQENNPQFVAGVCWPFSPVLVAGYYIFYQVIYLVYLLPTILIIVPVKNATVLYHSAQFKIRTQKCARRNLTINDFWKHVAQNRSIWKKYRTKMNSFWMSAWNSSISKWDLIFVYLSQHFLIFNWWLSGKRDKYNKYT